MQSVPSERGSLPQRRPSEGQARERAAARAGTWRSLLGRPQLRSGRREQNTRPRGVPGQGKVLISGGSRREADPGSGRLAVRFRRDGAPFRRDDRRHRRADHRSAPCRCGPSSSRFWTRVAGSPAVRGGPRLGTRGGRALNSRPRHLLDTRPLLPAARVEFLMHESTAERFAACSRFSSTACPVRPGGGRGP